MVPLGVIEGVSECWRSRRLGPWWLITEVARVVNCSRLHNVSFINNYGLYDTPNSATSMAKLVCRASRGM